METGQRIRKGEVKGAEHTQTLGTCPVCGRIMLAGDSVDRHHWRPKSQDGTIATFLALRQTRLGEGSGQKEQHQGGDGCG